jgi:hypothetical protein
LLEVARTSADYNPLIGWVRFVNGEQDSAPGVGLAVTERNPSSANQLRKQAASILRQIAEQNRNIGQDPWFRLQRIELPSRPRLLLIAGNHLKGISVHAHEGEIPLDPLILALEQGAGRLRLCKCKKLFLPLNPRGRFCSSACRQRDYYGNHTEAERTRKRREYHRRHARNQEMDEARNRGEKWVRPNRARPRQR